MSAQDDIEALVAHVAREAVQEGVTLSESTDALKALTPYYVALAKGKLKSDDEPSDGNSMAALRQRLNRVEEPPKRPEPTDGAATGFGNRRGRN